MWNRQKKTAVLQNVGKITRALTLCRGEQSRQQAPPGLPVQQHVPGEERPGHLRRQHLGGGGGEERGEEGGEEGRPVLLRPDGEGLEEGVRAQVGAGGEERVGADGGGGGGVAPQEGGAPGGVAGLEAGAHKVLKGKGRFFLKKIRCVKLWNHKVERFQ